MEIDLTGTLKKEMNHAVKVSGLSRPSIVDRMQAIADRDNVILSPASETGKFSCHIFEKWLNVNAKGYYPSLNALMIFCAVLKNNSPFKAVFKPFGFGLIGVEKTNMLKEAKKLFKTAHARKELTGNNSQGVDMDDNNKHKKSDCLKKLMAQPVPVHRILPTIRKYGSGKKTYHLELRKEYKHNNSFYRISNDRQREYCFDVPDEESMYKLADDLKVSLNISTDAQVIITETYEEFVLYSKPKKISAGHYIYRGYTIYDISYNSKEWWMVKGEYKEGHPEKIYLSSPKLLGRYQTLKFAMENVDILVDGAKRKLDNNLQSAIE